MLVTESMQSHVSWQPGLGLERRAKWVMGPFNFIVCWGMEGFLEEVTVDPRRTQGNKGKWTRHKRGRKSIQGRGDSMCKGPEAGERLMVGQLCPERELRRQAELEAWAGGLWEIGHDGREPC